MTNSKINLAIVGVGKIVRDQHLPSINKSGKYELIATASRNGCVDGVTAYKDINAMLTDKPEIQAVALCMPPQYRFEAAVSALSKGVSVLLEKPPGATVCEVEQLVKLAEQNQCQLYATWHSRHAASVAAAKQWLSVTERQVQSARIDWKEDVRKWHPGQEWIWQAGGLGVFDPGINGLSILTEILPLPFFVTQALLEFPENKAAPIAANIEFQCVDGTPLTGEFDWRTNGDEQWQIVIDTNMGELRLLDGGDRLLIDGEAYSDQSVRAHSEHREYEAIYARFASLLETQTSDVDLTPLKLVADAFLSGERKIVSAFHD